MHEIDLPKQPCTMSQYGTDLLGSSRELLTSLDRSAAALNTLAHALEDEFSERFGHTGANPLLIAKRLRKLQTELPALKQECQAVLSAKQELIDSARRLLDANSSQLQQLCSRAGLELPDDEGTRDAYSKAVQDWEGQVLQRHAGDGGCYSTHNLNLALARARIA